MNTTILSEVVPASFKKALFNKSQFRANLTLSRSPIPAYKKVIEDGSKQLDNWFEEDSDINLLVHTRAWLIDQLLTLAWEHLDWDQGTEASLLAVGGYGRGELHPGSDIDLLILLANDDYDSQKENIEQFLTLLWDIGLKIGSSVRSLDDCEQLARDDLSIITNLMESRVLSGPDHLHETLLERIDVQHMWPSKKYLQAKFEEQRTRHQKYDNSESNLEPNIKGSPGGIRDLHMLGWVARRHYNTHDLAKLVDLKFLSATEYQQLHLCRAFLWKIRWALHSLTGRCEDRLLFEHQRTLADQFGYKDHPGSLAVEQFMQGYFRTTLIVGQIKDMLLQHFDDKILNAGEPQVVRPLNERFQVCNNYIETVHDRVFAQTPSALLEMFVLITRDPTILGPRAKTIRLLRDYRHLVDSSFREDPRCTKLFLKLLQAPYGLTANLRRLARYGILGRYLPEFGRIIGQMQFDLFHIHTVDAHTLLLIKHLRSFAYQESVSRYPVASKLIQSIKKPELLYIAALYHDIGKGLGGDHSELGAKDALRFCRRHGLNSDDTKLIVWLVKEHLTLSVTAQKQDLSDPTVVHAFAEKMGTIDNLNHLYLLTVADINATNPRLWNGWRSSLLQQLYTLASRVLENGIDQVPDSNDLVQQVQVDALKRLSSNYAVSREAALSLWNRLDKEYFARHDADEIAWHTRAILDHNIEKPLVLVGEADDNPSLGGSKVFIYTKDQANLFAASVAALDQLHLSIQDAKIITSSDHFSLDTYTVLEEDGSAIGLNPVRISQIQNHLQRALSSPDQFPELIKRRTPRRLRYFAKTPEVVISNLPGSRRTLLEITATDRPGLLAKIGRTFMQLGLNIHNAKIATFGEKVEDSFFITDANHRPISDPARAQLICETLKQVLQQASQQDLISTRHKT